MALINNIYVLVEKEEKTNDVETSTHPTETGFPVSDSVRKQPISLSISGKIANTDKLTAKQIVAKLEALQKSGSLITYVGQIGTLKNLQIQSFKDARSNRNYGGSDFTMLLQEVKTAKSAYVKPASNKPTVKPSTSTPKIKVGSKVVFSGGYVYVSSDATKPAAKRGKSTCKVTIINNRSWAKHKYHLISLDGKRVYGWVDANKVKAVSSTTSTASNGGKQQVQEIVKSAIYYTVKKGDTIYNIVNKIFKSKGFSVSATIKNNPSAFSRKNDPKTLKIGARLKLTK